MGARRGDSAAHSPVLGACADHPARSAASMGAWSPCSHACPGVSGAGHGRRCRSSGWPRPRRAVSLAGLAGSGWRSSSSRRWTPPVASAPGTSLALAGRLWLLAQGGELDVGSGPLVLAPLLLTLGIAWGLSRAGRVLARLQDLARAAHAARATGVVVGVHVLLTAGRWRWPWTTRPPRSGCSARRRGRRRPRRRRRRVGGRPGVRRARRGAGPAARRPAPPAAGRARRPADRAGAVHGGRRGRGRLRRQGYATLSGSLGGAGRARSACSAWRCCCCRTRPPPSSAWPPGPGFFVGSGTLVSVHGVTLGAVPALPLLAALPDTQAVPLIAFVSQAIPALAGLVAGSDGRRGGSATGTAGRSSPG